MLHPQMTLKTIAEKTGYSGEGSVCKALNAPAARLYMLNCLDEANATVKVSAEAIAEAHQAERVEYFANKEGEVVSERRDPDHHVRLKAAELNLKVRGVLHPPDDERQSPMQVIFAKITQIVKDRGFPLEGAA